MKRKLVGICCGCVALVFFVCFGTPFMRKPAQFLTAESASFFSASDRKEPDTRGTYVYFLDCDGGYTKVDYTTLSIAARGEIWDGPSARRIRPEGVNGCVLGDLQYDYWGSSLYVVLQRTSDGEGSRFSIASLGLPDFKVKAEVKLDGSLDSIPTLMLGANGDELLVSYQRGTSSSPESNQGLAVLARYTVPDLRPMTNVTRAYSISENPKGPFVLSRAAYWSAEKIFDEDTIRDRDGFEIDRVDGDKLLTDNIRSKFVSLERTSTNGKKYLDATFADSRSGNMLFVVGWDTKSNPMPHGSGLLIYDALKRTPVSTFVTKYKAAPIDSPTVHLTADGELVVLEQYEWPPNCAEEPQSCQRIKTGKLSIYDVTGKTPERTIDLHFSGPALHVLGFAWHKKQLFYSVPGKVLVVDLTKDEQPRVISGVGDPVSMFFSMR